MNSFNNSFNPMQIQKPNYNDFIVKQPAPNKTFGTIDKRLIVDSRERDYTIYPKASNYVIHLDTEYRDVTSIEMVRASIPQSGYIITDHNNEITITETGLDYNTNPFTINSTLEITETIKIPIGDYTIHELVASIQKSLCQNKNLKSNYCVSVNCNTGKICIQSDLRNGGFHLKFCGPTERSGTNSGFKRLYPCNSMGKLLGFLPHDYLYACGQIDTIIQITAPTEYTMLENIFKSKCPNTPIEQISPFYKIQGSGTKFECEFNCFDFIRLFKGNGPTFDTFRFMVLSITDDNNMYGILLTEIANPLNSSFTPNLTPDPITNCMGCLVDNNPNLEGFDNEGASDKLYIKRRCCECNFCPSLKPIEQPLLTGPWKIYKGTHCGENKYDLFYNKYIILDIREMDRLDSKTSTVNDSFAIFPLLNCPDDNILLDVSAAPLEPEIKYFNPPLGKLTKLTINFITPDGFEYDFNGREHFFDLKIKMLNQQGKYVNL